MQMLQQVRKFLGVLLLIVVALLFFLDVIIERLLEQEGTRVVKAKVELDDVSLHYSSLGLTLTGLQVTDPRAPMTNAIEAETINLTVAFTPLLRRKIIVEHAALEGLKFNTMRKVSGAVTGLTPATPEPSVFKQLNQGIKLPTVDLPDPKALIESADLETLKRANALERHIQAKQQEWQQRLAALPGERMINGYQQQIAKLQQVQNPLKRIQALKEVIDIQQRIKRDLDKIRRIQPDLKRDLTYIRSELGQLKAASKQDIARMMNHVGLDTQSLQGFASLVFGREVLHWIDQGHQIYRQLSSYLKIAKTSDTHTAEAPSEIDTTDYSDGLPKFLIKELLLSGMLPISNAPVAFRSQITDITHQPFIWGRPTQLEATSQAGNRELITLKVVLDHVDTKNAVDQMDLKVKQWPLKDTVLSADKRFPVTLVESQMSSLVKVLIKGGDLSLRSNTFFDHVQLQQPDFNNQGLIQRALMAMLKDIEHFEVSVNANGVINQPSFKVKTSLDAAVQQNAELIVKKEREKLASGIQQEMDRLLSTQLDSLNAKTQGFLNIKTAVESKIEALRALL